MSKLKELKQEATELGITFNANIGEAKLQEKIDAFYGANESSSKEVEAAVTAKEQAKNVAPAEPEDVGTMLRRLAKQREAAAKKTKVVTIINNDQRDNNQTTSITVNCGNEYFDLGTRILPLNIPVEVEQGFLDTLKDVLIPQHTKNPKTGLSERVMRPKYTLSYENIVPE